MLICWTIKRQGDPSQVVSCFQMRYEEISWLLTNCAALLSGVSTALQAVPPFSFDSKKILHADLIDDIQIANNIARSADGEKRGCYGYWWTWQDTAAEVSKKLQERQD